MVNIEDNISANKGKTTCNKRILLSIISLATKEISGVSELVGTSVPDISFRVQENIKNNLSSMVDLKTGKINVHVVGVNFVQQKEEGAI